MTWRHSLETDGDVRNLLNSSRYALCHRISSAASNVQWLSEKHWQLVWLYSKCLTQRDRHVAAISPWVANRILKSMERNFTIDCGFTQNAELTGINTLPQYWLFGETDSISWSGTSESNVGLLKKPKSTGYALCRMICLLSKISQMAWRETLETNGDIVEMLNKARWGLFHKQKNLEDIGRLIGNWCRCSQVAELIEISTLPQYQLLDEKVSISLSAASESSVDLLKVFMSTGQVCRTEPWMAWKETLDTIVDLLKMLNSAG